MAAVLPVVISKQVSIWREVSRGDAGIIVDPQARATADAMNLLLDDPETAARMSERGSRLTRHHFTWDAAGTRLTHIYRHVASPEAGSRMTANGYRR